LGVGVSELDAERAKTLKLKDNQGVEIKSVDSGSPAEKAGLKAGDVVLTYNDQTVEGNEQFARLVRETPSGRPARLKVWRDGHAVQLTATIGSRPAGIFFGDGDGWTMEMPAIPPIPKMSVVPRMPAIPPVPDLPHSMLSWRSGTLGLESESLGTQLAAFFGVQQGVLVRSVVDGSAAAKAGIKAGDVIVRVEGTAVATPREISSVLRASRAKRTLSIVIVREKHEITTNVELNQESRLRQ
ncbi:MAG TPA: PDZ domain-containing protein, partial [Bryobacteraceae bacterium]|nr:PDZ domain-containing protein [Bryobacteraceae bacterium]